MIDNNIIFYYPIKPPYFSNPEILNLTTLQSYVNYKSCYYSLGLLVVFSLLKTYLLVNEEIDPVIEPLYNTKIYWFIKRCLNTNINHRKILLI